MMSFAPYQSCLSAASARWTEWADRSHMTWSQYGSMTARKMRSFVGVPESRGGSSLMVCAAGGAAGAGVLAAGLPMGLAADLSGFAAGLWVAWVAWLV